MKEGNRKSEILAQKEEPQWTVGAGRPPFHGQVEAPSQSAEGACKECHGEVTAVLPPCLHDGNVDVLAFQQWYKVNTIVPMGMKAHRQGRQSNFPKGTQLVTGVASRLFNPPLSHIHLSRHIERHTETHTGTYTHTHIHMRVHAHTRNLVVVNA